MGNKNSKNKKVTARNKSTKTDIHVLNTYEFLLRMGFEDSIAFDAANTFKSNINAAIEYISNSKENALTDNNYNTNTIQNDQDAHRVQDVNPNDQSMIIKEEKYNNKQSSNDHTTNNNDHEQEENDASSRMDMANTYNYIIDKSLPINTSGQQREVTINNTNILDQQPLNYDKILFSELLLDEKCSDDQFTECICIQRISILLTLYQNKYITNNPAAFVDAIQHEFGSLYDINNILNDYIHIIYYHINDLEDVTDSMN
eukprot:512867_1